MLVNNKKARFDYEVISEYTAGIVLDGWEVKSLRAKNANPRGAWVTVRGGEIFLKHLKIGLWPYASDVMDIERDRKLLLTKREIAAIISKLNENGTICILLGVFAQGNKLKARIATAKARKKYQKKQVLKDRSVVKSLRKDFARF